MARTQGDGVIREVNIIWAFESVGVIQVSVFRVCSMADNDVYRSRFNGQLGIT